MVNYATTFMACCIPSFSEAVRADAILGINQRQAEAPSVGRPRGLPAYPPSLFTLPSLASLSPTSPSLSPFRFWH